MNTRPGEEAKNVEALEAQQENEERIDSSTPEAKENEERRKSLQKPQRRPSLGASCCGDEPSLTDHTEETTLYFPSAVGDDETHGSKPVVTFAPDTHFSRRGLSEDLVASLIHDYIEDLQTIWKNCVRESMEVFYGKYHTPDYVMIRPSGNPLASSGWIDMFCSKDLSPQGLGVELVSIDSIQLMAGGEMAVVIYTVDQMFKYKGMLNEDRSMVTCVVVEMDGQIKMCHEHRATGTPIPTKSRWETGASNQV